MATNPDEVTPPANNETESSVTNNDVPTENAAAERVESQPSTETHEENTVLTNGEVKATPTEVEEKSAVDQPLATSSAQRENQSDSLPSPSVPEEQRPPPPKSRSVNFSATDEEIDLPKSRPTKARSSSSSSYKSSGRSVDFIDALVESYKLETSNHDASNRDEKKYVPKTSRSRLNPNWREHRTRHLMNKLEELSLWDREEEMKASQAQALREQKWEQILDRQRNHDLCLNLMRQRHESEMESAVVLDRGANAGNDENKNATIARAMKLASPANVLAYDLPSPPATLKRRAKKDQEDENGVGMKTAIGRYRQFENKMSEKVDKINQKLQPDLEIMRAYSPYRTSIPANAVPLFSETYSALLSVPDSSPSNKYNQYHYGVASYLHQPHHAASPDYETRLRSYANRDVRVPLKEQANDYNSYDDEILSNNYNRSSALEDDYLPRHRTNLVDDDYYPSKYRSSALDDDDYSMKYRSTSTDDDNLGKYRTSSRLNYSPPRRTTSLASPTASALYDFTTVANTPRDFSFLHSRPPTSNSIHQRSLNDDLNAITRFSTDTSKRILQNVSDSPTGTSNKSSRVSANKRVSFNDRDDDNDGESFHSSHFTRSHASKPLYQPVEILSLSSSR